MTRINRLLAALVAAGATSLAVAQAGPAASYPNKPMRLPVGYAAGGGTDVISRMVAQALGTRWNEPGVLDNQPGASGISRACRLSDATGIAVEVADRRVHLRQRDFHHELP